MGDYYTLVEHEAEVVTRLLPFLRHRESCVLVDGCTCGLTEALPATLRAEGEAGEP